MSKNNKSGNDIAVRYLGVSLITVLVGIILYSLASLGYNTYISFSQEKIEVQATNSNSLN